MSKILNTEEARILTVLAAGVLLAGLGFAGGVLAYQSGVESANAHAERIQQIENGWTPTSPVSVILAGGCIGLAALAILLPSRLETPEENAARHAIRRAKHDAKLAKRLDEIQEYREAERDAHQSAASELQSE